MNNNHILKDYQYRKSIKLSYLDLIKASLCRNIVST